MTRWFLYLPTHRCPRRWSTRSRPCVNVTRCRWGRGASPTCPASRLCRRPPPEPEGRTRASPGPPLSRTDTQLKVVDVGVNGVCVCVDAWMRVCVNSVGACVCVCVCVGEGLCVCLVTRRCGGACGVCRGSPAHPQSGSRAQGPHQRAGGQVTHLTRSFTNGVWATPSGTGQCPACPQLRSSARPPGGCVPGWARGGKEASLRLPPPAPTKGTSTTHNNPSPPLFLFF